jgi:hypothetical protein
MHYRHAITCIARAMPKSLRVSYTYAGGYSLTLCLDPPVGYLVPTHSMSIFS